MSTSLDAAPGWLFVYTAAAERGCVPETFVDQVAAEEEAELAPSTAEEEAELAPSTAEEADFAPSTAEFGGR